MSYNIVRTNGTPLATVADGQVNNTATSLVLLGKNYAGYGTFLNENFVKLLENFASSTAPTNPSVGQLWWKADTRVLQVRDAFENWKTISGAQAQADQPSNSVQGDLWFDSVNQQLKTYTGSTWLTIGPSFTSTTGTSGAVADTIIDNAQFPHVVVKFYVQNSLVAILSKDATFTPSTALTGFPTVKPGFNLSSSASVPLFYYENANNSAYLGGSPASAYLTASNPVITAPLTINNPLGITIQETGGSVRDFDLNVSGGYVNIVSQVRNNGLKIQTAPDNNNGSVIDVFVVDQDTGLITVLGNPVDGTGIATKDYCDSSISSATSGIAASISSVNGSLNTLAANTTVVYGNVRTIQSHLGFNNPNTVPTIGGTAASAYTKITTGDTFAGNLLTLWANVSSIHSNVLSGSNNMYSNVRTLQTNVSTLNSSALMRDGSLTITGNIYPDASNTYDFARANASIRTLYANVASVAGIEHRGTDLVGEIGSPSQRFGNVYAYGIRANVGDSFFDSIHVTSITIGGGDEAPANTMNLNAIGHVGTPSSGNIGFVDSPFGIVFHTGLSTGAANANAVVTGTYTLSAGSTFQATYADLAERFRSDNVYSEGTVVKIGGDFEITMEDESYSRNVLGVISEKYAYLMNNDTYIDNTLNPAVALIGRVPVRVIGQVTKGDRLVAAGNGVAMSSNTYDSFNVIGRALESSNDVNEKLIMAIVKVN